jgi:hypothetical protein
MIHMQSNKLIQMNSSHSDLTANRTDQKMPSESKLRNEERGTVRKTISSSLTAGNKGNTIELLSSSSSLSFKSAQFGSSRMIQKMFLSCIIFVVVTVFYAGQQSISIIKHHSTTNSFQQQQNNNDHNLHGVLDIIVMNRTTTTATKDRTTVLSSIPGSTDNTGKGITQATRVSVSTFVQKEAERMILSSQKNTSSPNYPCINSARWLNSPRYGNINNETYLTHDLVQHMILNLPNALIIKDNNNNKGSDDGSVMSTVLRQTICHTQSRFIDRPLSYHHFISSLNNNASIYNDTRMVRLWAVKLIYLAIHYHQHRLAVPEAVIRYSSNNLITTSTTTRSQNCSPSPQQLEQNYNVGIFDYECPDAKYIIMPLGGNGLGSNVRGGMVVAFLIGLSTDRIVLFVNNARGANHNLHKKWSLASCPRHDYQCFFWPTSPCTLTNDEINSAYALTQDDYRKFMKKDDQLKHIEQHKVWSFNTPFLPVIHLPTYAGERLYQHAITLISAISKEEFPIYHTLLMEAAETIRVADTLRDGYNYAAANTKVQHALAFYSMRPNPRSAHQLDQILDHIIPETFPPETSIGLPIRGMYLFYTYPFYMFIINLHH